MTQSEQPKRFFYSIQLISSALGALLSVYLLVHHTRVKNGIQEGRSFCSLGAYADCDVVAGSSYSEILGVPVAAIGGVFFFLLFALSVLAAPRDPNFQRWQKWAARVAAAGVLFDVVLFTLQTVAIKTFCIVCLMTYVVLGAYTWALFKLMTGLPRHWGMKLRAWLSDGPRGKWAPVPLVKVIPVALSFVLFVALLALLPTYIRQEQSKYAVADTADEQFFVKFREESRKLLPVEAGDGTFGNPGAKIQIVVFSDFQCPFCKRAAFTLHNALSSMEDRIQVVFKHYPLDSSCNAKLTYQMHPFACRLARLAYCANQKGKFWPYHDFVFLQLDEERLKEGFDAVTSDLHGFFTPAEIDQCLRDPKSAANVAQGIELGNQLKIRATPSVFINGKFISIPLTVNSLRKLIAIEEALVTR